MATETKIRIRRNPYHGYEVWIYGNGELTRRSFDNSIDLAAKLAADCFDDRTIEEACDLLDVYEWGGEPEFPLGVSYRPVAEACCDCVPNNWTVTYDPEPSPAWDWLAATIRLGAITAPWVLVVILVRWAGGW
jgi:hypothetical protein